MVEFRCRVQESDERFFETFSGLHWQMETRKKQLMEQVSHTEGISIFMLEINMRQGYTRDACRSPAAVFTECALFRARLTARQKE